MADCATYEVPFASQILSGGATGPYDCTAWSASRAIGHSTCGAKLPSGRNIRLLSNEAVPDPRSPGLNLLQVADVAWDDYGVWLDVRIGDRAVAWAEYERRRIDGQGAIIQVTYAPIADSSYDAGRGFRGNHAIFESVHDTIDPLADGRYSGCFRHDGNPYPRALMKRGAELLVTGGTTRAGVDNVWSAFTRDVIPDFRAVVRPPDGRFWAYHVPGGRIAYKRLRTTGGFTAACTPPRSYAWSEDPTKRTTLVRLLTGSRAGMYLSAKYAKEV